jgi:hypothetical protein
LQLIFSYGKSFTNLEYWAYISIMKREEKSQVLEMLQKDYISVNICVIQGDRRELDGFQKKVLGRVST